VTGPDHGTQSRYVHHGCRCQACREANTRCQREQRARQRIRLTMIERVAGSLKDSDSGYQARA
jgi:hypothetical protein